MKDRIYQMLEPHQWQKLHDFIYGYFLSKPAAALAAVLVLILAVMLIYSIRTKGKHKNIIKIAAFLDYVVIILLLSVLNRDKGTRTLFLTFLPWKASETTWHESNVLISLIDVGYFMPLGALGRWLFSKSLGWLKAFLTVAVIGFMVEFLQYVLARGMASISDFTAYIVGGSIGIIFTSVLIVCKKC